MKAQLGRPTGLALALLSALLATFLAMGIYGVVQANEHSATRSFSATTVQPGDEITVTIALSAYGEGGSIAETLPEGFSFVSGSILFVGGGGFARPSGNMVNVVLAGAGITNVTYKVTAPSAAGGPHAFSGNFVNFAGESVDIGGDSMVTVSAAPPPTPTPAPDPMVTLSSHDPGAAVQITLTAVAAADIMPDQQIEIDLSAFSVPDTIADSGINISSAGDGYRGTPSDVSVDGKKVTLTIPNVKANGDNQDKSVMGNYTIRIKQSAGVKNAASAGEKTVKWQENFPDGAKKEAKVNIDRVIKLSKTKGTRGTMITATFKGFANGDATVDLNGKKLAEVPIEDNLGTLEIDTTPAKFMAGANTITAEDATGIMQVGDGAVFTINPKAVVDPEESPVSKEVTIKLSDWTSGIRITMVEIGADDIPITDVTIGNNGKAEFQVTVPKDANRGTQTVKVTGEKDDSTTSATTSLKVGVLALTVQPAKVVPGQEITIEGSGFARGDSFDEVVVGGIPVPISPAVTASSAGDIVIAIDVPSRPATNTASAMPIGDGEKTIEVAADGSNRVAEGTIEIPKATITLDPATSRRGTTVNVSGSGFPSSDLVQIKYDNGGTFVTVAAGSADASGAISIDFVVPSYARIGTEHEVEATSVGVYAPETAKATHNTPGAKVSLSTDRIASGQSITISGMNFPAFATVAVMEIGGVDVRPVPAPATSIDGDFESTVLVPQLELGNQTVSVRVSQTTETTFLEIGTVAVSRDPADVFASLGERLSRVWYLDRATQEWLFYDPDPDIAAFNTLDEVTSGQVVQVIISEGDTIAFQGTTLYAGTNPIALD